MLFLKSYGDCSSCHGDGKQIDIDYNSNQWIETVTNDACHDCEGTGLDLTDIGVELFEVLKRAKNVKLR